jgi:aquaporin Z
MRKYVTEFIGTFGLVFKSAARSWAARRSRPAIGAVLVLCYAGGHISGAHYNWP